jgi:hypothetical protein
MRRSREGFASFPQPSARKRVFSGDPARQVTDQHLYSGGGRINAVANLSNALAALGEIAEQGEGANRIQVRDGDSDVFHPERDQVAHYYRFQELKLGRRYRPGDTPRSGPTGDPICIDWNAVRPIREPPTMLRVVRFGLPKERSTILIARSCNVSKTRLTAPHSCSELRSEQCTP